MDTSVAGAPIPTYEELCRKSKPYRTMSYPTRSKSIPLNINHHVPQPQSKKETPLDANDLSRRLQAHLAQQKALARERRFARVSMATGIYHHIPQVAVISFETTATPDKLRQVHKLSEPALKSLGYAGSEEDESGSAYPASYPFANPQTYAYLKAYQQPSTVLQKSQLQDHAVAETSQLRNRNQYQWTPAMERAAELDAERDVYRCPRRTFHAEVPAVHKSRAQRPMSMGFISMRNYLPWEERDVARGKEREKEMMKRKRNDRHDWTQRDEDEEVKRGMRARVGPLLSLKSKKGKEKETEVKAKMSQKSPTRVSFFERFRRGSSNSS